MEIMCNSLKQTIFGCNIKSWKAIDVIC